METIDSPYEGFLGMCIAEKRSGFCKIRLPLREELTNPHGNFHGGTIASIVDTATVQGLRTVFPKGPYLTVSMEIRYKNPSSAAELFAEAHPQHLRGKFFRSDIKVIDSDNKLIAEAEVKSFLPEWGG